MSTTTSLLVSSGLAWDRSLRILRTNSAIGFSRPQFYGYGRRTASLEGNRCGVPLGRARGLGSCSWANHVSGPVRAFPVGMIAAILDCQVHGLLSSESAKHPFMIELAGQRTVPRGFAKILWQTGTDCRPYREIAPRLRILRETTRQLALDAMPCGCEATVSPRACLENR